LTAVEAVVSIAVAIAAVYGVMQLTRVMWIEPPSGGALDPRQLAALAAQHHGATLLAMVLGGVVALLAALSVLDTTRVEQAKTMALMPLPLLATIALSVALAPHRAVGLVVMALIIGLGTYLQKLIPRVGSRAFLYGVLLFIGYLFGFLGNGTLTERQLGPLALGCRSRSLSSSC
jgi:hypothetical protein